MAALARIMQLSQLALCSGSTVASEVQPRHGLLIENLTALDDFAGKSAISNYDTATV